MSNIRRLEKNEIVQACQKYFGFALPSVQLSKRAAKFENRLRETSATAIYIYIVEIIVDAIWTAWSLLLS